MQTTHEGTILTDPDYLQDPDTSDSSDTDNALDWPKALAPLAFPTICSPRTAFSTVPLAS